MLSTELVRRELPFGICVAPPRKFFKIRSYCCEGPLTDQLGRSALLVVDCCPAHIAAASFETMQQLKLQKVTTLSFCLWFLIQAVAANSFVSPKQQSEHLHEVHCSRERSRAAWKIIDEYLMPFVEKEKYQITRKCRLHPDNDMFRDQEQHKKHADINEWQCEYCMKSFYAEKFLDQHFVNRHYDLINVNDSKCLADLCGALHCDLVMDFPPPKTKCNPAAVLKHRHMCESLANSCFPLTGGPSASRLHELFLRQFCDAHSCSGGRKPFSRGGKKRTSMFYICLCVLTLTFLPLFYSFVYMYQKGLKRATQDLRRISQPGRKKKPS